MHQSLCWLMINPWENIFIFNFTEYKNTCLKIKMKSLKSEISCGMISDSFLNPRTFWKKIFSETSICKKITFLKRWNRNKTDLRWFWLIFELSVKLFSFSTNLLTIWITDFIEAVILRKSLTDWISCLSICAFVFKFKL